MGFNQRKPPDHTVCVAVDLSAAFDTICHNKLLSKIYRSPLPPATLRWLSSYLKGRQAKTGFISVKSSSRGVHAGVLQDSKLSSSLISFYRADMPTPTEPVKRVCYADDLTVWATGVNIPDMEDSLNSYLKEITEYLKDNSLLISTPKCCCCLPTPMTLASGGSPMFRLVVHQPASPSIWPAVQSLRRGLSTNPGATMWCVCGCS